MKVVITGVILSAFVAGSALAQVPQQPSASPSEQASQYMISQLTTEKLNLLTQVATAQQTINQLEKQLADARKPADVGDVKPPEQKR